MKKNLTIIASAVLALGMLFVTGCKNASNLGDDTSNAGSTNINGAPYILQLEAKKAPIDWWVLTDENKVVLQLGKDFEYVKNVTGENTVASNHTYKTAIAKDKKVEIKFKDEFFNSGDTKRKVDIYFFQKDEKLDDPSDKSKKDVVGTYAQRGQIEVSKITGTLVNDTQIKQTVAPVATFQVTCDENKEGGPATVNGVTMHHGKGHGTYNIKEIWPLKLNEETKTYEAVEGLKFRNINIPEGGMLEIIYPANVESFFAISQPDRYTKDEAASNVQDNWYWCFKTSLPQYQTYKTTSSTCEYKYKPDENKVVNKNDSEVHSATAVYFIDPSEFVEAGDIK